MQTQPRQESWTYVENSNYYNPNPTTRAYNSNWETLWNISIVSSNLCPQQVPKAEFLTNPLKHEALTPTTLTSLANLGQTEADRQVRRNKTTVYYNEK